MISIKFLYKILIDYYLFGVIEINMDFLFLHFLKIKIKKLENQQTHFKNIAF